MAAFIPARTRPSTNRCCQGARRQTQGRQRPTMVPGSPTPVWPYRHGGVQRHHSGGCQDQIGVLREQNTPSAAADLLAPAGDGAHRGGHARQYQSRLQYLEAWIRRQRLRAHLRTGWKMPPPPRSPAPPSGGGSATVRPSQRSGGDQGAVPPDAGRGAGGGQRRSGRDALAGRVVSPRRTRLMDGSPADTLIDFLTLPGYERLWTGPVTAPITKSMET